MIAIDPALDEEIAELLVALEGYLESKGLARNAYAVGPQGQVGAAPYRFSYPLPSSYKTWPAQIAFPAADGEHLLTSDFSSARTLLAALLTLDPDRRWERLPVDAPAEAVMAAFALPTSDYLRPSVPTQQDRMFVAPGKEGFVFGYVDIRPPAVIFSRSAKAAPPAVHLALEKRAQDADLFSALAEHLPPFP